MFTSTRRRSRIAHFQAPVVVSIASAAALAGCGGRTLTDDENNSGDAPSGTAQANGDATRPSPTSPTTALPCSGPAPAAACGIEAFCVNGQWLSPLLAFCNPPPTATSNPPAPPVEPCPDEMPIAGSDCFQQLGHRCWYPGCEGGTSSTATCIGGQWLVQYSSGPACNPPAVIPICPERPIVASELCAYDGQRCSNDSCDGVELRSDFLCSGGSWSAELFACPQASADAGTAEPDAGL